MCNIRQIALIYLFGDDFWNNLININLYALVHKPVIDHFIRLYHNIRIRMRLFNKLRCINGLLAVLIL